MACKVNDRVPITSLRLGNMIRLNADSTTKQRKARAELDISQAGRRIGSDRHHQFQSGSDGTCDDIVDVVSELGIVEMCVRVNHVNAVLLRGNDYFDYSSEQARHTMTAG